MDKVQAVLTPLVIQYPLHVLGGDLNSMISPNIDGPGIQTPTPWPWLQNAVLSSNPSLLDTYRFINPWGQDMTRFPSLMLPTECRIDYILTSIEMHNHFPCPGAEVHSTRTFSDHHPCIATFNTPALPISDDSPPPRAIFRTLVAAEKLRFQKVLAPVEQWCQASNPCLAELHDSELVAMADAVLRQVTSHFHTITKPQNSNKPTAK